LVTKAPDALRDAKEVGKAIAFELAIAAGFHTTDGLRLPVAFKRQHRGLGPDMKEAAN
jgi:hypothetical protein